MPNWTENVLTVRGEKSELEKFRSAVRTSESAFDFNSIKPYPTEYAEADTRRREWRERLDQSDRSAEPKGGFDNGGCEWCCEHWGTKWPAQDVSVSECPGGLEYWFLTAWSPPLPILLSVSNVFPALLLTLEYAEAGMDFSGLYETKAGKVRKEWAGAYTPAVWNPAVDMEEYERQFED